MTTTVCCWYLAATFIQTFLNNWRKTSLGRAMGVFHQFGSVRHFTFHTVIVLCEILLYCTAIHFIHTWMMVHVLVKWVFRNYSNFASIGPLVDKNSHNWWFPTWQFLDWFAPNDVEIRSLKYPIDCECNPSVPILLQGDCVRCSVGDLIIAAYLSPCDVTWCPTNYLPLVHLKHWGRGKMAATSQTPFSNEFSLMKMYKFWEICTEILRKVQINIYSINGSDNGLASTRRQAIIWTNDAQFSHACCLKAQNHKLNQWFLKMGLVAGGPNTYLYFDSF